MHGLAGLVVRHGIVDGFDDGHERFVAAVSRAEQTEEFQVTVAARVVQVERAPEMATRRAQRILINISNYKMFA